MIELVVASMAGASVWIASRLIVTKQDPLVSRRISDLVGVAIEASLAYRRKQMLRRMLALAGSKLPVNRASVEQLLTAAGATRVTVDEMNGVGLILALAGLLIATRLGPLSLFAIPVLSVGGYKIPELALRARISRRHQEIEAELPDVVDLLAVCTRAGLNIALSLNRVAEAASGALGDELRRTVARVDLGVPRAEALSDFASRLDIEDVDGLVSTIVGAERFGTQLGPSLTSFAAEVRGRRRRRAEEHARRAPVKMLFPLVFLILPGFIFLTLVPLVLSTFQSLGF